MYQPYGAGPASKNFQLLYQEHRNIRESSECSRNSPEIQLFSETEHIYITLYILYIRFSHYIRDFRESSHNSLVGKSFYNSTIFNGLPPSRLEMLL